MGLAGVATGATETGGGAGIDDPAAAGASAGGARSARKIAITTKSPDAAPPSAARIQLRLVGALVSPALLGAGSPARTEGDMVEAARPEALEV